MQPLYKESEKYLKLLAEFNPVYYTLIVVLIIILVVYIINRHVIIPARLNHMQEKKDLENENNRLMALFAELDPDPLLRIDRRGTIIKSNRAAESLFAPQSVIGKNIEMIFPEVRDIGTEITDNITHYYNKNIGGKYYSIIFRGISELDFAQVYFHDITERHNYEQSLKNFSVHLQESIEEERKRIAKELHDGVGQNLSLARFKAQIISGRTTDKNFAGEVQEIKSLIEGSISELKEISHNLKPRILDEIGLESALMNLVSRTGGMSLIKGQFRADKNLKFTKEQETQLFRITQEALNNIVKHSQATEFNVNLLASGGKTRLVIIDNGNGFDPGGVKSGLDMKKGMGLISMKERAESIGAKLEIDSSEEEGTMIVIEIPEEEG
ncbi:MAG: histidine kinase [Syntrophothermus sp.]